MKYTTILNGRERELEVLDRGDQTFLVRIDEQDHLVDARPCGSDLMSLLIDNRSYDISFSSTGDLIHLHFWNRNFSIEVLDERKMRMRRVRSTLDHSGPEIIRTSMPGKVVKLLVKEGDAVKAGDGIIIIEAMKMENMIQCRNPGIVKRINTRAGVTVESDVVLVEIDPE